MGKHIALIKVIKEELVDCKDNIYFTVQDLLFSSEGSEDSVSCIETIEGLGDELEALGDFLYDLLGSDFNKWDTIVALNKRIFLTNPTIQDAIRNYETYVELEVENIEQVGTGS